MTLLGLTSRTTFFRWKKSAPAALPPDTLERLSHVFAKRRRRTRRKKPDAGAGDAAAPDIDQDSASTE
jgi:hypothetical protein